MAEPATHSTLWRRKRTLYCGLRWAWLQGDEVCAYILPPIASPSCPAIFRRLEKNKADGYKHPPARSNRSVYSFPNTGGGAVSGGAHSPVPIAKALGKTGRSSSLLIMMYIVV